MQSQPLEMIGHSHSPTHLQQLLAIQTDFIIWMMQMSGSTTEQISIQPDHQLAELNVKFLLFNLSISLFHTQFCFSFSPLKINSTFPKFFKSQCIARKMCSSRIERKWRLQHRSSYCCSQLKCKKKKKKNSFPKLLFVWTILFLFVLFFFPYLSFFPSLSRPPPQQPLLQQLKHQQPLHQVCLVLVMGFPPLSLLLVCRRLFAGIILWANLWTILTQCLLAPNEDNICALWMNFWAFQIRILMHISQLQRELQELWAGGLMQRIVSFWKTKTNKNKLQEKKKIE